MTKKLKTAAMPSLLLPNEDGVLEPSGTADLGPVSENERVLSLAANTGGSGEGMSHYSQASRCGRRARLSAARYKRFADEGASLPASKNHFVIGSVYHKLHELARRDDKPMLDYNEQFKNPNVAEGVRLYRGWLNMWSLDFWGDCLGVEVQLADKETFALDKTSDPDMVDPHDRINVTGQLDMVVDMDDAACDRARRRGLELTPGRRIVDWKTADSPSDGTSYRDGLQAIWYCHLWNLHHPEAPVDGIIFDVVCKRSRRKDRSVLLEDFQAFYVPAGVETVEALRGMVLQGHRNIAEDSPNRSECVSWRGDVCPFRLNGECDARSS